MATHGDRRLLTEEEKSCQAWAKAGRVEALGQASSTENGGLTAG